LTIVGSPSPAYLRYVERPAPVAHDARFVVGRAERVLDGSDATVLVHGALFTEAFEAARLLGKAGRASVRLLNMRTLDPVDGGAILAAARETGILFVVEDHFASGGLKTIVCEVLAGAGVSARVVPLSFESGWFTPALLPDVLRVERLDSESIAERIAAA